MSVQARLVVVGGDVKTSEIKLRLPCTIGRGRGSSIVLAHPLVSRQHCEVFESGGRLMVRDLGSLNGTFVNNQRIGDTAPLPPNELLTIGTVTFRAVYDEAAAEPPADAAGDRPADTVYAGRGDSNGTGTVPFPGEAANLVSPRVKEQSPASASSQINLPPAAQLPASGAGLKLPSGETGDEPQDPKPTEPGEDESKHQDTDDDLQDFLKGLGKK